jgi:hypothetical protein
MAVKEQPLLAADRHCTIAMASCWSPGQREEAILHFPSPAAPDPAAAAAGERVAVATHISSTAALRYRELFAHTMDTPCMLCCVPKCAIDDWTD